MAQADTIFTTFEVPADATYLVPQAADTTFVVEADATFLVPA